MRRVGLVAVFTSVLCSSFASAQEAQASPPLEASDAGAPDPAADGGEPALEVESAHEAPAEGVGDIVVTAQRRRTNLQQTPISITAISGEALHERGITDLSGVAEAGRATRISALHDNRWSRIRVCGAV